MKTSFLKCLGLFCIIILTGCSQPHTHSLGSYESIDKNNHALICSDCGEQYDSEPHDFISEYVEGDCLHESYTIYTCELCDYSYKEYGSEGEHTPSGTYITSESYHWDKCSICGATYNQENHDFKFDKHLLEPTCEQKGTDIYKCSVCGYEKDKIGLRLLRFQLQDKTKLLRGSRRVGSTARTKRHAMRVRCRQSRIDGNPRR